MVGRNLGRRVTPAEMSEATELPPDFTTPFLMVEYSYMVRGNGVPLHTGRAIADEVRLVLEACGSGS